MIRKNKYQHCYTLKDIYSDYIKDIPEGDPRYVSIKQFTKIISEYNKAIMELVIYESKVFKLPFRLGHFGVIKKKPKKYTNATMGIDWELYNKDNIYAIHLNDHCGGYKYRYHWSKKQCMMHNRNLFRLVLSRHNKRELAKAIKEVRVDYPERNF